MHFSTTVDSEAFSNTVWIWGEVHLESDVDLKFFFKTLTDLSTGDKFPFLSGKWGVVDQEIKNNRWFIDRDSWEEFCIFVSTDSLSDEDVRDTCNHDDVTCLSLLYFFTSEAMECKEFGDLCLTRRATMSLHKYNIVHLCNTFVHTSDRKSSEEVVIRKVECLHTKCLGGVVCRNWNFFQNRFKKRGEILAFIIRIFHCNTITTDRIHGRKVELFIMRTELHKEFKYRIVCSSSIRTWFINLVDNNNRFETKLQ